MTYELTAGGYAAGTTLTGTLSHVAVTGAALSATRLAAHANAALTGFANESSDARATRLAAYAGLGPSNLDLETGVLAATSAQATNGTTVGAALDAVSKAEGGVLFIAGDGRVTLHNRNHRVSSAVGTAQIAVTSGDVESPTVSGDRTYLRNYAKGSRPNGAEQLALNQTSIDARGRYGDGEDYAGLLVTTDAEVLSRVTWAVNQYGDVKPRVTSVTLDLTTLSSSVAAAFLGAEIGDRLTISGLPSQAPSSTVDLIIEGWEESLSKGNDAEWKVTFNTAPADLFRAFIVGDATYGVVDGPYRMIF